MNRPLQESWRDHLPEWGVGLGTLMVSAGALVFLTVLNQVTDGDTLSFDRTILLAFRQPDDLSQPLGGTGLETVIRDITALGGFFNLSLLTLAVVVWLALLGKGRLAAFIALCVAGGAAVNTLLKELIDRGRPDLVPHGTDAALSSFPSGHAMMAALTFLTLGLLMAYNEPRRRLKVFYLGIALLLSVAVGLSRIYLGVHWPTDILAGWVAGATWALLCLLLGRTLGAGR